MRRASKFKIPWFKVHTDLEFSRKFERLSLSDAGCLLKLWLDAYRNHAEVGFLHADLGIIGRKLGGGYAEHPRRATALLERFVSLGWLDKHINNGSVRYELHHWEEHQASKFDVFEPMHTPTIVGENKPVSDSQPTVNRQLSENHIDNTHVTPPESKSKSISVLRTDSHAAQADLFSTDDFEAGINQVSIPINQFKTKRKPKPEIPEAERIFYHDLLAYMENSFMTDRRISLPSISNASDYSALRAMIRKLIPAGYALNTLQAAWARFLHSDQVFHRSQGHPIRYWASNLGSFLSDTKQGQHERVQDRRAREVRELMAEVDAAKS